MTKHMDSLILRTENLSIGHTDRVLYSSVSFDICRGDCIMLCGANGSGKTTLLKQIAAMASPSGKEIVMIPARIPKVKGFTLREYVRLSCFRQSDLGGRLPAKDERVLDKALERLHLSHLTSRDISTLSDGEFQKASIASSFVRKADILLMDEPTAFLDAVNRISILQTLRDICNEGRLAIIFSTHDLHDGLETANKVFALGADGNFRCSTDEMKETVRTIFF